MFGVMDTFLSLTNIKDNVILLLGFKRSQFEDTGICGHSTHCVIILLCHNIPGMYDTTVNFDCKAINNAEIYFIHTSPPAQTGAQYS